MSAAGFEGNMMRSSVRYQVSWRAIQQRQQHLQRQRLPNQSQRKASAK
jgi:hypothetical protein